MSAEWIEVPDLSKETLFSYGLNNAPHYGTENFVQLLFHSPWEQNEVGIDASINVINILNSILILIKCINCIPKNKFIWRLSGKTEYYSTVLFGDLKNILTSFCEHFLENEIRNKRSGVLKEYQTKNEVSLMDIGNHEGSNLLIIAAKDNKKEVIEELLKHCFDIDYEDKNGLSAIDYAWMNYAKPECQDFKANSNEIILMLLKSNSKFPKINVGFNRHDASPEVMEFIRQSECLRVYVKNNNIEGIKAMIKKFPCLRHFYDFNNVSILQYSMIMNNNEAFNLLTSHYIITGSNEDRNEAIKFFQKRDMVLVNLGRTASIKNNCVFELSNLFRSTKEHNDDLKAILGSILSRFNVLSNSEISSIILEIAAANRNFKIFLDFSQEPSNYFNKVTSARNDIYIAAQCAVENVILDVISKLCDLVADITCLEYSNKFPENIGLAKILKYYCGIQQLPECLTDSFKSNLDDNLKESLHVLIKLRNGHPWIHFDNITPSMQEFIFHMTEYDPITAANLSQSEIYKILLHKNIEAVEIKVAIDRNKFLKRCFVKVEEVIDPNRQQTKTMEEIMSITQISKIFLLIDESGTGKSVVLKDLEVRLNKGFKGYWVSTIPVNKHRSIFESLRNELSVNEACDLLLKILNPGHKKNITKTFKSLFLNDKVILLFDDIGDMDQAFGKGFISLLRWLKERTKNQVLIAARLQKTKQLEEKFNVQPYKLVPFTRKETEQIFGNILNINEAQAHDACNSITKCFKIDGDDAQFPFKNASVIATLANCIKNKEITINESFNSFKIVETICISVMQKNQNTFTNFNFPTILMIHQIYALILFFSDECKACIQNLPIMKNWEREERKWTLEMIEKYGILNFYTNYKINDNYHFSFIDEIFPSFFVAKYIIYFLFTPDFGIKKQEFLHIFTLLRHVTRSTKNFKLTRKLLISYAKETNESICSEIRNIITKNIENLETDILKSKDPEELQEFWSMICSKHHNRSLSCIT